MPRVSFNTPMQDHVIYLFIIPRRKSNKEQVSIYSDFPIHCRQSEIHDSVPHAVSADGEVAVRYVMTGL